MFKIALGIVLGFLLLWLLAALVRFVFRGKPESDGGPSVGDEQDITPEP